MHLFMILLINLIYKNLSLTIVLFGIHEAHVDEENKIVTAPAFMCETKVHEIFDSVGSMVNGVLKLC